MAVGDIDSNDRGTGARFNDGKLPMQLIPVRYWRLLWTLEREGRPDRLGKGGAQALLALERFERGDLECIRAWLTHGCPVEWLDYAVQVFDYGRGKYKAWNWAKGMAWSVPMGCILRHAKAMYEGESIDPESNLPHVGHIVCNMIMLDWFVEGYPEGNDLPPPIIKT